MRRSWISIVDENCWTRHSSKTRTLAHKGQRAQVLPWAGAIDCKGPDVTVHTQRHR